MKYKFTLIFSILILSACTIVEEIDPNKIRIVTTTTIFTDMVENIGGDKVSVSGLMGPGIDPHLYKASEGDVTKLANAQLIIYGGLHLEGKLVDVFSKIERSGKHPINLGKTLDAKKLIASDNFGGNYDPHIWFDVELFIEEAKEVARVLIEFSPENEIYFQDNLKRYLNELYALDEEIHDILSELPNNKRHLVTAHDAFGYFGKAYDFKVIGLQGLSTAAEAGVRDVRRVSDYIVKHEIKSIFVESSVPRRTIEALQQAVLAKGHKVEIGEMLYSDALGDPETEEGTYIGMFRYNVKALVKGLK